MDSTQLKHGMTQFTGTEQYYRHAFSRMVYTDGVKFFAENAGGGAYWFLDIVGTELIRIQKSEPFISIGLIVEDGKADIIATDGKDNKLWGRVIEFTDCPEGEWMFYLINEILLLVGEY